MKKDPTERLLYRIANITLSFLMINFWFLLTNIFFMISVLVLEPQMENILFYIISLIPTGPALAACFASMDQFLQDGDINATRTFFSNYKKNFKSSCMYWLSQLFLILIFSFNSIYIRENTTLSFLLPLLLALFACILLTNLYAFPLLTRYHITLKNLWIISMISLYKYWYQTLLNLFIVAAFIFLFFQYPLVITFSFASVMPYLLMYNLRNVLKEIGENYQ